MAEFDLSAEARTLVVIGEIVGDDELPESAEEMPAYLIAEFEDSDTAVLKRGAHLWSTGLAHTLVLCAGTTADGSPPFDHRVQKLRRYGVPYEALIRVSSEELHTTYNTLTETRALVQHARETGYTEGIFVAAKFHLLRTAMTVVGVVLDEYPEFRAYFLPGMYLPWSELVTHSQGVIRGRRWELLRGHELNGIRTYPNMPLPTRVLEYLVARWR